MGVIGLSVDYVVHMAHMYVEAGELADLSTRTERFHYAASKMGSTVLGGAITTAGSALFMLACQMVFFTKMSYLILLTIIFSFSFSFGWFMSMALLVGPEGHSGDIRHTVTR